MHASGHMSAHCAHPVQLSGSEQYAGWKPRAFIPAEKSIEWRGQTATQSPQPLHILSSILTVI